jgi:ABC-type transport system involved in Fe-S cluster assembly fused permease/ATPase subunit
LEWKNSMWTFPFRLKIRFTLWYMQQCSVKTYVNVVMMSNEHWIWVCFPLQIHSWKIRSRENIKNKDCW